MTEDRVADSLATIRPMLGRHLAFHRRLVDVTQHVKATLLLSQCLYWTRRGRDLAGAGGWFYKTAAQWTLETGLSLKEQAAARDCLRARGLLDERRAGIPARLYFRVNLAGLHARLARAPQALGTGRAALDAVLALLGPPVAYYRGLCDIAGGVHPGLLLSAAVQRSHSRMPPDGAGWLPNSAAHWHGTLGFSRREQETARRRLMALGFWEERLQGVPARLIGRIRPTQIALQLRHASAGARRAPAPGAAHPDTVAASGDVEAHDPGASGRPDRVQPGWSDPPIWGCAKRQTSYNNITAKTLPLLRHGLTPHQISRSVEGDGLIFPAQLLPQEQVAILQWLPVCREQAQCLLDELAGRLRMTNGCRSPVAYLRGLAHRAAAGRFHPELAPRIAAERHRRAQDAALQITRHRDVHPPAVAGSAASKVAHREKLSQLRERLMRCVGVPGQP